MAEERKGSTLLRPRFLLFCMYVMLYVTIRSTGEIGYQTASINGSGTRQHIVGPTNLAPRWRRQVYRIFFSPLMVAEEEGRRLLARGEGLVRDAGRRGRDLF